MEAINYQVLNTAGKKVGDIELDGRIFAAAVKQHMVHDAAVWQLAKRRAGTASALTKAEVRGGGKKPWKQKGTGNARAGSSRSPLWVGGGVTHGPKPRDYTSRLSKRAKLQALCSVLTEKRLSDKIRILDKLALKEGKTKEFKTILENLGLAGERVLLISASDKVEADQLARAARNIPGIAVLSAEGINVYDLLKSKFILSTKADIDGLQEKLNKQISK